MPEVTNSKFGRRTAIAGSPRGVTPHTGPRRRSGTATSTDTSRLLVAANTLGGGCQALVNSNPMPTVGETHALPWRMLTPDGRCRTPS